MSIVLAMTEPDVASSDATKHPLGASSARTSTRDVNQRRKWWTSGAGDPRCRIAIFNGPVGSGGADAHAAVDDPRADGRARRHDRRMLNVFGYDDRRTGTAR